jgi:hypothetical protein
MRKLLSLAFISTALALVSSPAAAQWAPWCFVEVGHRGSGATSCTFHSFAQCEATRIGIGGICQPNPYLSYGAARPGDQRPVKRRPRR